MQISNNISSIKSTPIICLFLSLWLVWESCYGLLQIVGEVRSKHVLFPMTGHFDNPGPLGGFLAMLVAICAAFFWDTVKQGGRKSWIAWVCISAATIGFILLPSSLSRAGWLGLFAALLVLVVKDNTIKERIGWKPGYWIIMSIMLFCACIGCFLLKKDSALGRFHIWHMESLSILSSPWEGCGYGRFLNCYGETQHNYFASGNRATWEIRVAGCPEYAFNEYLKAGVEWGIPGLVLAVGIALLVCIILVKNNNPLGYGAVSLSVFSFFSYPMSIWQFQICSGLFVIAAFCELTSHGGKWILLVVLLPFLAYITNYKNRFNRPSDYRLVYQHGYQLFQEGQYDNAIEVLQEGVSLSCDPMFHNIIGRCYEATGRLSEAEIEYWHSHYMVPGRLYPLVLLQEMYLSNRDTMNAEKAYSIIADIPVNHRNSNMKALRERADNNHQQSLLNNKSL